MTNTTLNLEELLCGVNELVDTLWIVTLGNEKVEIIKDSMTPEREGECLDYTELCQTYIQEYVYPADLGKWEEILSLNSLRQMAASGVANKKFDMRFCSSAVVFPRCLVSLSPVQAHERRPSLPASKRYYRLGRHG